VEHTGVNGSARNYQAQCAPKSEAWSRLILSKIRLMVLEMEFNLLYTFPVPQLSLIVIQLANYDRPPRPAT
jgi:hypothetical protein